MIRALIPLALIAATPAPTSPVTITAPMDLSEPSPPPIRVSGLRPHERLTIKVVRRGTRTTSSSAAVFVANRRGRVDTGLQAPVSGSYSGVAPLGLYWSAKARAAAPEDPPAGQTIVTANIEGQLVSAISASNSPAPDRVAIRRDTPFPGAVYARPIGAGRYPVLIVLGGSEGGAVTAERMAPLFAAQGYAVLGLPYHNGFIGPPIAGLPDSFTDIPVDRLVEVRGWLARQPDADVDRLGIWGVSKGSEFALLAASHYPWIKAVVAVVPTDLVWEGWGAPGPKTGSFSFEGKPLAFQPYDDMEREIAALAKGAPADLARAHAGGRTKYPERVAAARIPIERYRGKLLLIGGDVDRTWPSGPMARAIALSRRKAGLETELLVFSDAGHALGGPGTDPTESMTELGGTAPAIARARAVAWRATFSLFDRALRAPSSRAGGARVSSSLRGQ